MPAFGGFGNSTTTFGNTNTNGPAPQNFPPNCKPMVVDGAPDDTVSSLNFSPVLTNNNNTGYFCASSWAGDVRLWEMNLQNAQSQAKAQQTFKGVPLDTAWSSDGSKIFVACADKLGYCWDIASNQVQPMSSHDEPLNTINVINMNGTDVIMTTSFGRKVKFWQLGNNNPISELELPFKVYKADACFPIAVCIGEDRGQAVISFQNNKPEILPKNLNGGDWPNKLSHQLSCVTIFKNKNTNQPDGFAVGSTEGRSSLTYFNPDDRKKDDPKNSSHSPTFDPSFAFKCHRQSPAKVQVQVQNANGHVDTKSNSMVDCDAFTVNFVKFHPQFFTLLTAGSDGTYTFWDKDQRTKLGPNYSKGINSSNTPLQLNLPLTAGDISPDGKFFVYAVGYDWSYGHEYSNLQKNKPVIYIHPEMVNANNPDGAGTLYPKIVKK